MKNQNFEDYLKEVHCKGYNGTADDMPDAFDDWCLELTVDEIIDYANKWGKLLIDQKN